LGLNILAASQTLGYSPKKFEAQQSCFSAGARVHSRDTLAWQQKFDTFDIEKAYPAWFAGRFVYQQKNI
jgi:hypothetical protein